MVASSILVESFSCCSKANNSRKAKGCCWEEGSQHCWPVAGMGGCSPHAIWIVWILRVQQPSSPNTIALAFVFWESHKPQGGWDERGSSRSVRRNRKCLAGVQEGERGFTSPSTAREGVAVEQPLRSGRLGVMVSWWVKWWLSGWFLIFRPAHLAALANKKVDECFLGCNFLTSV